MNKDNEPAQVGIGLGAQPSTKRCVNCLPAQQACLFAYGKCATLWLPEPLTSFNVENGSIISVAFTHLSPWGFWQVTFVTAGLPAMCPLLLTLAIHNCSVDLYLIKCSQLSLLLPLPQPVVRVSPPPACRLYSAHDIASSPTNSSFQAHNSVFKAL
jgi:hypothetical protein